MVSQIRLNNMWTTCPFLGKCSFGHYLDNTQYGVFVLSTSFVVNIHCIILILLWERCEENLKYCLFCVHEMTLKQPYLLSTWFLANSQPTFQIVSVSLLSHSLSNILNIFCMFPQNYWDEIQQVFSMVLEWFVEKYIEYILYNC